MHPDQLCVPLPTTPRLLLLLQVLEANGICCAKAFRGATVFVYRDDAVTEAVVVSKIRVRASEPLHAWLSKYAPGPQYKVNQVVPPGGADLPWKVYVAAKAVSLCILCTSQHVTCPNAAAAIA